MSSHCENCRNLRERAEELEETVRQLKALAYGEAFLPPADWRLTPTEVAIVQLFCALPVVNRDAFVSAMEARNPHWCADVKIFDVYICKLRHKLSPFGVEISTIWGQGYRLAPAQREAVRTACVNGDAIVGPPISHAAGIGKDRRDDLLAYLAEHPLSSIVQMAEGLGIGPTVAQNWMMILLNEGRVTRERAAHRRHGRQPPFLYSVAQRQGRAA